MERKDVLILCPAVGHGNPATAVAVDNLLRLNPPRITTELMFPVLPSIPANIFHKMMTKSPKLSSGYSQDGESLRDRALFVMGWATRLEFMAKRPEAEALIAVQEHLLGAYSRDDLEKSYPEARVLYIPDTMPKDSAIKVAQKCGLTMAVWNADAANRLEGRGVDVCLMQPVLPDGFVSAGGVIGQRRDRIIVKSSGSGMPKSYELELRRVLDRLGEDYSMYLPDRIVTPDGVTPLKGSLIEKIKFFYQDIIAAPPRVLICFLSEMTQVAAGLKRKINMAFLNLPARGPHEVNNGIWAQETKIHSASIVPGETADLSGIIRSWFDDPPDPVPAEILGLGTEPVASLFSAARKTVATV